MDWAGPNGSVGILAWIESHTVLSRHRKLRELAIALRLRPAYVAGHLHLLWHAALEQQEDGDLSSWTDQFIADQADFAGDAPQFVRLLQQLRWLDDRLIHDWLDYAGRYLESKYKTSNPRRLREIWNAHGINYDTGESKSAFSPPKGVPPTLDNPPTNHSSAAQTGPVMGRPRKKPRPPNPDHTPLVRYFCDAWEKRRGAVYPFDGGKDAKHISEILRLSGTTERACAAIDRFLDSGDRFAEKQGFSVSELRRSIARWVEQGRADEDEPDEPEKEIPPLRRQCLALAESRNWPVIVGMGGGEDVWRKFTESEPDERLKKAIVFMGASPVGT